MKITAFKCSDGTIVETLEAWQNRELSLILSGDENPDTCDFDHAARLVISIDKVVQILTGEEPKKPRAKRKDAGKSRKSTVAIVSGTEPL